MKNIISFVIGVSMAACFTVSAQQPIACPDQQQVDLRTAQQRRDDPWDLAGCPDFKYLSPKRQSKLKRLSRQVEKEAEEVDKELSGDTPVPYGRSLLVGPGTTIAGHTFTPDTAFGTTAINDKGDFAFIARWKCPTEEEAVFTSRGIVARSGETLDGHYISAIPLDGRLAINSLGQVAFTAKFTDYSFRAAVTGVFLENHLVLTPSITPVAFELSDDNRLVSEQTERSIGYATQTQRSCAAPKFPRPTQWSASPRIASYRFEPSSRNRRYAADLPFLHFSTDTAYRLIYFGSDCLPLMIVLGDEADGAVEVQTREGLLTAIDQEGYFDLFPAESFIQVETDEFTRKSPSWSMNQSGQVLLPINSRKSGLYLLTPKTVGAR